MKTVVISSFKGGTAKTSNTLHLSSALAKYYGKKVLLIDFDSQANLSSGLGFGSDQLKTMVPVLQGNCDISSVIHTTKVENLSLIPGNVYLDGIERMLPLVSDPYSHERLRKSLQGLSYDYCFIDIPPSLGWLTQSAYFASQYCIVSATLEPFSMLAIRRLVNFHHDINENHSIELAGIVLSMCDQRIKTNEAFVKDIESLYPGKLFQSRIRRDVNVPRSVLTGDCIFDAFPKSSACEDYRIFADEFLNKCNDK